MKILSSKGFTIVELLIVITIIALLTAIVLVNVNAWNNQSKDASIQANLNSIQTNSVKFINEDINGGSYTGFCADSGYTTARDAIANIGVAGQNCQETNTTFCACSSLKGNPANVFCVDHTGIKKLATGTDCATECPATGDCL